MWRAFCHVVAFVATMSLIVSCRSSGGVNSDVPKTNVNRPTFNLILEDSFSGPERELIVDAFKEWETDTNGVVKFVIAKYTFNSELEEIKILKDDCTYDAYIFRTLSSNVAVKKLDKRENAKVLGYTSSTCARRVVALVIDRLKSARLFRQVSFHEAGHLVGLDHIPVPNESTMFPSVDKATSCASSLDMKQLCMLYTCNWKDMKTCDP